MTNEQILKLSREVARELFSNPFGVRIRGLVQTSPTDRIVCEWSEDAVANVVSRMAAKIREEDNSYFERKP